MERASDEIFYFLSARDFLENIYIKRKDLKIESQEAYSYRIFSIELGLNGTTHLYQFIKSKKNLSRETIRIISKSLGLKFDSRKYFKSLVEYDEAQPGKHKIELYNKILELRRKYVEDDADERNIEYLSEWYHIAIRELVLFEDFVPDTSWICSKLNNEINEKQAKRAFELLQKNQFITYSIDQQKWIQLESEINIPRKCVGTVVARVHEQFMDLSKKPLHSKGHKEREFGTVVFGIKESEFKEIQDRLVEFRTNLAEEFTSEKPDAIVHLGLQLTKLTT